jgi:uncharacterized protein YndB with AHSA1/START domain
MTNPDQLSTWFGTSASLDRRPGGNVSFTWDQPGVHGTNSGVIEIGWQRELADLTAYFGGGSRPG